MPDQTNRRFIIISYSITFLFIIQIILCILFYNWLKIDLLAYIGWIILILGIIILWKSQIDFKKMGKKIEGKSWLETDYVVDIGIYSVIRHPMYLSFILMALGLILMSQYWLMVIIGIARVIMLYYVILEEEKSDLKRFGHEYEYYMSRVPQLNFFIGILYRNKNK